MENPLWLEIVFAVYPLDKTGKVISEKGTTLHQGVVPSESREGFWVMRRSYDEKTEGEALNCQPGDILEYKKDE